MRKDAKREKIRYLILSKVCQTPEHTFEETVKQI